MDAERPGLASVSLVGAVAGAVCAVALTTYAGGRVGSPAGLRVLFAGWVLSPFAALVAGRAVSNHWRASVRAALQAVTLVIAAISTVAYAYFSLGAARPLTAAFVIIPPVSWLVAAAVIAITALVARE